MADFAYVDGNTIVNVVHVDDPTTDEWQAFLEIERAEHDEVDDVTTLTSSDPDQPVPWIGWTRAAPGQPFTPPPEEPVVP